MEPKVSSRRLRQAPELLTGAALAERIKDICRGDEVRVAVAFWGGGAAWNLFGSGTGPQRARILCDVTLGGTQEKALRELGAPGNKRLRQVRALHVKLYLSERGAVNGSANASGAALGFDGGASHHVELGVYHPPEDVIWRAAKRWFDNLYRHADQVDDDALARARLGWRTAPPWIDLRPGSLLDAISLAPDRFRRLAFFLEKNPLSKTEAALERAASAKSSRTSRERNIIAACSHHNMFTGLTDEEVRDTPPHFIEFWRPNGGPLRVFARRVEHRDRDNGTLYTVKAAREVGRVIPGGLPSLASAASLDDAAIHAFLKRRRHGINFLSPEALLGALAAG